VPPDILMGALRRYGEAGIWAMSPEMSRAGFARLAESLVSGGFLRRMPSYEDCVEEGLEPFPMRLNHGFRHGRA
jgi:NitT/TauT family transport system substrate-binding protein